MRFPSNERKHITEMIKFIHAYGGKNYSDLVDGLLIKLSEVSRNGSTAKYRIEAAVDYEKEIKEYLLVTKAGLSKEGALKGHLRFDFLTQDIIPKTMDGIPTSVEDEWLGKVSVIYEVNTRLGPEELDNPINLAPRVADLVLFYRDGIDIEDYRIISTNWKELPSDISIPREKIPGFRILQIDLEARLSSAKTSE